MVGENGQISEILKVTNVTTYPKSMQDKKSQNSVKTGSFEVIKKDNNIAVSRSLPDGSPIESIKPTLRCSLRRLIAIHNLSQKMVSLLTPLN